MNVVSDESTEAAMATANAFHLEIAGMAVDVEVDPRIDTSSFAGRAHRYRRASSRPADEVLTVRPLRPGDDVPSWYGPPRAHREGDSLVVEFSGARLTMSTQPGRGDAAVRLEEERFRFENVLRILISRRLLQRGGMMLHAAALSRGDYGVAFPGVSGAGKSTLTLRHPENERISEDLVAIRPRDGVWIVEALPFIAFHQLDLGPKQAHLMGLAFLRHAKALDAARLRPDEVRHRLGRTLVSFAALDSLEALVLDRLVDLSRSLPAIELGVGLTDEVWPILQNTFGKTS